MMILVIQEIYNEDTLKQREYIKLSCRNNIHVTKLTSRTTCITDLILVVAFRVSYGIVSMVTIHKGQFVLRCICETTHTQNTFLHHKVPIVYTMDLVPSIKRKRKFILNQL